jgi:hypothetical protein
VRAVSLTGVLQGATRTVRTSLAGSTTARALSGGLTGPALSPPPLLDSPDPITISRISTPPTTHGTLFPGIIAV